MHRFRLIPYLLVALLSFFTTACSSDSDDKANKTGQASVSGQSAPASSKDAAEKDASAEEVETDKWNAYVALDNLLGEHFFDALHNYGLAFGDGAEFSKPKQENDRIRFTNEVIQVTTLQKKADEAAALAATGSSTELDKAVIAIVPGLKALWADMTALSDYLRNKEQVDDDWAKARTLHPRILASMKTVEENLPAFQQAMAAKSAHLRATEVDRMKAEGLVLLPAMFQVVLDAEDIQMFLSEKEATHENLITAVTEEEFRTFYTRLGEGLKELDAVLKEETAKAEGISFHYAKLVKEQGQAYKKDAATLIEHLQNKKNPSGALSDGAPDDLTRKYSLLVDRYNSALK